VKKVRPDKNQVELNDGASVDYDFLVIATGLELAGPSRLKKD